MEHKMEHKMEETERPAKKRRIKACKECRQLKLRCDLIEDKTRPCSRCRQKDLKCYISNEDARIERRTKAQLLAELEALKQQPNNVTDQSQTLGFQEDEVMNGYMPFQMDHSAANEQQGMMTTLPNSFNLVPTETYQDLRLPSMDNNISDIQLNTSSMPPMPSVRLPTQEQTLDGFVLSAEDIDECFVLFVKHYQPQIPVVEADIEPNKIHNQSPLLFWTIVAIGAKRYESNPVMLSLLAPKVINLAKSAVFSRNAALYTVQAFILLCSWPMPIKTLEEDITPMLAGAAWQLAMSVGLHVYGVGQDFARVSLPKDSVQTLRRAKIWAIFITVCQRISCVDGTPPISVPDHFGRSEKSMTVFQSLSPSIRFEKALGEIQSEAILEMERKALWQSSQQRAIAINSIIHSAFLQFDEMESQAPGDIERFYLACARLQILGFHLFLPRHLLDNSKLMSMFSLACTAIEIILSLDEITGYAEYAPLFISKYLHLAACTILKLGRCHIAGSLDLSRGSKAYFANIKLHKRMSVQAGDVSSHASTILINMWASQKIFKRADGKLDSLTLRCGSRLAMSLVYDCWWWWRAEFAALKDPYEEGDAKSVPLPIENIEALPSQFQVWPMDTMEEQMSCTSNSIFGEGAWPTAQDLMLLDWPHLDGTIAGT